MYEKELKYLNDQIRTSLERMKLLKSIHQEINQIQFVLDEAEPYSRQLDAYVHGTNVRINVDGWTETDVLDKIIHPIAESLATKHSSNINRITNTYSADIEYHKNFWINDDYSIAIICTVVNSPDCEVIEYKEEVTRYKLSCAE